jgi:hypothetical protein
MCLQRMLEVTRAFYLDALAHRGLEAQIRLCIRAALAKLEKAIRSINIFEWRFPGTFGLV